jgi:alpha-beta hydrolase superfamily lysophospholipase
MPRVGRYSNPAMNLSWAPDELPPDSVVEPVTLPTPDRVATTGLLFRPAGSARATVAISHPRVDSTNHYLIPPLLRSGYAVWAQRSRNVNNDLTTTHEQLLVDLAVAHAWLAARGHQQLYLIGNSGGASLYCFYAQQASRAAEERLTDTPSGLPVDLTLDMPAPAGLVLLAPHAGQGDLLLHCIDPAVTDEADPHSVDPALDLFDPANGFHEPPESSSYDEEFLSRYRLAQRNRVARIDERAQSLVEERRRRRREARESGDPRLRRAALAPSFMTIYRTDADPRAVDLSLDPSARDYGSIFGRRPDLTNAGPVGFGRLATPDAWLSTWSGLSTRAAIRLTGPDIHLPVLLVSYTADNSVFPSDIRAIAESLRSADTARVDVEADHFGYAPGTEERRGGREAAEAIVAWLEDRT